MTWIELVAFVCASNFTPQLPDQIKSAALEFEVDETLVLSIIHTESRCDPNALGSSNDTGMMQIIPKWHQQRIDNLRVDNLFDPYQNIRVGSSLLSSLNVNEDITNALVIYNGGYAKPPQSYKYAEKVISKLNYYNSLITRQ